MAQPLNISEEDVNSIVKAIANTAEKGTTEAIVFEIFCASSMAAVRVVVTPAVMFDRFIEPILREKLLFLGEAE